MKSRERSSYGRDGTGNGHNNLGDLRVSYIVWLQSRQAPTKIRTSSWIPAQTKFSLTRAKFFAIPIWPPIGEEWNSMSKVGMNLRPLGNQMSPFCKIKSCTTLQSECSLVCVCIVCLKLINSGCSANSFLSYFKKVKFGRDKTNKSPIKAFSTRERAFTAALTLPRRYWME